MEAGFVKLLTVLLSLANLGVEPNPAAPPSAEVLRYAPGHADAMAYLDFGAFVPNNYAALKSLPTNPQIKHDKHARAAADKLVQTIDGGLAMVKNMVGIDPVTDVKWASAWMTYPAKGDPKVLAIARANLPADFMQRLAKLSGSKVDSLPNGQLMAGPDGEVIALTKDGYLLFGDSRLVKARVRTSWRPRAHFHNLPKVLDGKPFLVVASAPSRTATRRFSKEISDPDEVLLRDLATGHKFAAIALAHDGVSWVWEARTSEGLRHARMFSEGMIDLLRAGHLTTRGMVKTVMPILASYARVQPELAMISKYEKQIIAGVDSMIGDGQFQVKIDADPKTRTLSVHAWDKELSRVLPMAGVIPVMAGAGAFFALARVGAPSARAKAPSARGAKATPPTVNVQVQPASARKNVHVQVR